VLIIFEATYSKFSKIN
jgi:hypothetical protein